MPDSHHLDIEWIAMKAGVKPANRVSITPSRLAELEARADREGLAVVRAARMIEFPGREPSMIAYVAPEEGYARSVAEAEAPLLPPDGARLQVYAAIPFHVRLGQLLGFPSCCIDAFVVRLRRGVNRRLGGGEAHEDFVAAECAVRQSQRFLGRLNDLSPDRRVRVVTFYPCRYDCQAAAAYASAVLDAAEKNSAPAAAALRAALIGRMTMATNGNRGLAVRPSDEAISVEFSEL